jgi:hypothetical protein
MSPAAPVGGAARGAATAVPRRRSVLPWSCCRAIIEQVLVGLAESLKAQLRLMLKLGGSSDATKSEFVR